MIEIMTPSLQERQKEKQREDWGEEPIQAPTRPCTPKDVLTGLLWDKTPTAGSHGLFSRRERASAPAAPVFVVDESSILSIRMGI